jgi:hypothetical protein
MGFPRLFQSWRVRIRRRTPPVRPANDHVEAIFQAFTAERRRPEAKPRNPESARFARGSGNMIVIYEVEPQVDVLCYARSALKDCSAHAYDEKADLALIQRLEKDSLSRTEG